jgi:hypothetical protein
MTTNTQEARSTSTATPSATPTAVKGVAVYDRDSDRELDSSMSPSASMRDDAAPVKSQSSGNAIAWIIGIVLLIIIAYFILQMFF